MPRVCSWCGSKLKDGGFRSSTLRGVAFCCLSHLQWYEDQLKRERRGPSMSNHEKQLPEGKASRGAFYTSPSDAVIIIRPRPKGDGFRLLLHQPPDDGSEQRRKLRAFAEEALDTFATVRDAQEVEVGGGDDEGDGGDGGGRGGEDEGQGG